MENAGAWSSGTDADSSAVSRLACAPCEFNAAHTASSGCCSDGCAPRRRERLPAAVPRSDLLDRLFLRLMAAGSRASRGQCGQGDGEEALCHRFVPFRGRRAQARRVVASRCAAEAAVRVWVPSRGLRARRMEHLRFELSLLRRRSRGRRAAQCPLVNPPIQKQTACMHTLEPPSFPQKHISIICSLFACELFVSTWDNLAPLPYTSM